MTDKMKQLLHQTIGTHFQGLFLLGGFLVGVFFTSLISLDNNQFQEILVGFIPELGGIILTVFGIDRVYRWRESQQLKKQLIEQLGSRVNSIAINAAEGL